MFCELARFLGLVDPGPHAPCLGLRVASLESKVLSFGVLASELPSSLDPEHSFLGPGDKALAPDA